MAYVERGVVKPKRSLWRLRTITDFFWSIVNFIGVFFSTLFSMEKSDAYRKGLASGKKWDGGGPGGPGGGPYGGGPRGPPRGLDNVLFLPVDPAAAEWLELANIMGRYEWLTCPRKDLSTGWLHCDPGPLFKPEYFTLPGWVTKWFPWGEVQVLPVQWHALLLGLFASIIAPFGGFFASGFKRAFKIKDFGDSIPGHGGITDRMDCQMVMAVFAYIYHQSFVVPQSFSVDMILDQVLMNLTFEEQRALYIKLGQIIHDRHIEEY